MPASHDLSDLPDLPGPDQVSRLSQVRLADTSHSAATNSGTHTQQPFVANVPCWPNLQHA